MLTNFEKQQVLKQEAARKYAELDSIAKKHRRAIKRYRRELENGELDADDIRGADDRI